MLEAFDIRKHKDRLTTLISQNLILLHAIKKEDGNIETLIQSSFTFKNFFFRMTFIAIIIEREGNLYIISKQISTGSVNGYAIQPPGTIERINPPEKLKPELESTIRRELSKIQPKNEEPL